MPTRRCSGSRAKTQNRSEVHIWRIPWAGRCASQSWMRECGSDRNSCANARTGDNPKLLVLLLHLVQFAYLGG